MHLSLFPQPTVGQCFVQEVNRASSQRSVSQFSHACIEFTWMETSRENRGRIMQKLNKNNIEMKEKLY